MSDERRLLSPVAVTLLKAAEYIEEHGWCQETFETDQGAVCTIGALNAVGLFDGNNWRAREAVRRHINLASIAKWNDTPGRTQAEVVKALRDAALAATGDRNG